MQALLGKKDYTLPTYKRLLTAVDAKLADLNAGQPAAGALEATAAHAKTPDAGEIGREAGDGEGKSEQQRRKRATPAEEQAGSSARSEGGDERVWDAEALEQAVWAQAALPGAGTAAPKRPHKQGKLAAA